jgi:hypothetical protein
MRDAMGSVPRIEKKLQPNSIGNNSFVFHLNFAINLRKQKLRDVSPRRSYELNCLQKDVSVLISSTSECANI